MDFLLSAYHLLVGLPSWAWVALAVVTLVGAVWIVIDIISFLLVSVLSLVVGFFMFMFGFNYLRHLF